MKKTLLAASLALGFCLINTSAYSEQEQEKKKAGRPSGKGAAGQAEAAAQLAALTKVCEGDISKFCTGMEPGPSQGECLKENESKLSAECGKTLASMPPPPDRGGPEEDGSGRQKGKAALVKTCKDDIAKFCQDIEPGINQAKCLMENEGKLSAECGKTLKSRQGQKGGRAKGGSGNQEAEAALAKGCKTEISKYCKGIDPGRNQRKCLKQNRDELSAGCAENLKSLQKSAGTALMKVCKDDIGKFCKNIEPGPEQGKCLKENESKLSSECGKALASMPPPPDRGGSEEDGPGDEERN